MEKKRNVKKGKKKEKRKEETDKEGKYLLKKKVKEEGIL